MDRCRCQQRGNVLAKPEEADTPGKVRLLGARSDARAITRVARRFPSLDVSDDVEGHAGIGSPQLRNRLEEKVHAFWRNDLTNEDDASRHRLTRMPRVGASRNGVVDDARFPRGNAVVQKLMLDEARIGCVLVDAVIDNVAPEIPIEASPFGSVAETKYHTNAQASQDPERRS